MRYAAAMLTVLILSGCNHHGRWKDGESFAYPTDQHYILDTGEECGEVSKSNYEVSYSAWVHGGSKGEWETLEQAKHKVESDFRCQ